MTKTQKGICLYNTNVASSPSYQLQLVNNHGDFFPVCQMSWYLHECHTCT